MTKIMQIVAGVCHWDASHVHKAIEDTVGKYPPEIEFAEAPDYVFPGWGYVGGEFIRPTAPECWEYDDKTGTFYPSDQKAQVKADRYSQAAALMIREKISLEDECKILREMLAYPNDPAAQANFANYNNMIIECRVQAMDEYYPVDTESVSEWAPDTDYTRGNMCAKNGTYYRCLQGHRSQADWSPEVAVSLWVKTSTPGEEWPEWVQPAGAHDAYMKGAKVSHSGKHWVSTADHNVWEPGVYGWSEAEG